MKRERERERLTITDEARRETKADHAFVLVTLARASHDARVTVAATRCTQSHRCKHTSHQVLVGGAKYCISMSVCLSVSL